MPDWSRQNSADRLKNVAIASGFSKADYHMRVDGIEPNVNDVWTGKVDIKQLSVGGVKVGIVRRTHYFGYDVRQDVDDSTFNTAMHAQLQAILPQGIKLQATLSDPTYRKDLREVVRVVSMDTFADRFIPPTWTGMAAFAEVEELFMTILRDPRAVQLPFMAQHFGLCLGRTLFTTEDGGVGIGPGSMQEGDQLVVLLGCDNVMVLRRRLEADHYHVVGNAKCSGLLDGEAILGPLPDEWERVRILNRVNGTYFSAFRERRSRKTTYVDPRLPPLEADWVEVSGDVKPGGYPLWLHNKTAGQLRDYRQDPRLDGDVLERRGVKLEEFVLV